MHRTRKCLAMEISNWVSYKTGKWHVLVQTVDRQVVLSINQIARRVHIVTKVHVETSMIFYDNHLMLLIDMCTD